MNKKHNYPLVEVKWTDASSTSGWKDIPHLDIRPLICWTAGYQIHKDKKVTIIALSCSSTESNSDFGDTITIPTKMVISTKKLK